MTSQTLPRLLRLGAARKLTRAGVDGEFTELNPVQRYDITASA